MRSFALAARPSSPAAQARQRGPAPRVARRADRHERQAHELAHRFLRGDTGLGRFITPAEPAGFRAPGSRGEPLPSMLRASLERAFDADLGAVRLHRDAAAAVAVADQGALAMASGASIFLGAGLHPGTTQERAVAHELVHVLQQTARATHGERLRATPAAGSGAVQHWTSPLPTQPPVVDTESLLRLHLAATSVAAERAAIQALLDGHRSAAPGVDFWQARAAHVIGDSVDAVFAAKPSELPVAVRSALYDGLKFNNKTAAAVRLLHDHTDLVTAYFSADTYAAYVDTHTIEHTKQRLLEEWDRSPLLAGGSPRAMLDHSFIALVGTTVEPPRLTVASGQRLVDVAARALVDLGSATGLVAHELQFVALLVARQLEDMRHALLHAVWDAVRVTPEYRANRLVGRWLIAQAVLSETARLIALEDHGRHEFQPGASYDTPETMHLWFDDLLPALRAMARYASQFLQMAATLHQAVAADRLIEGTDLRARAALAGLDTELPQLRPAIVALAHAVLDRNADGSLPDALAFEARIDAALATFNRHVFSHIERPLADRMFDAYPSRHHGPVGFGFTPARAERSFTLPRRAQFAWALGLAAQLRMLIAGYVGSADAAMVATQAAAIRALRPGATLDAPTSQREVLRHRFADRLFYHADQAGWLATDGLGEWLLRIVTAREMIGGAESTTDYVAFNHDWELDDVAPIARMMQDAADLAAVDAHLGRTRHGTLPGIEPFSVRDLTEFFLALEHRRLSTHIDTALGTARGRYQLADQPVLNQAVEAARREERPERNRIRDWVWARPVVRTASGRFEPRGRQELGFLLRHHPLTQARINQRQARLGYEPGFIVGLGAGEEGPEPVLWTLPTAEALIERLQRVDAVNQLMVDRLRAALAAAAAGTIVLPQALADAIASGSAYRPDATGARVTDAAALGVADLRRFDAQVWWDLLRTLLTSDAAIGAVRAAMDAARFTEGLTTEREQAQEQRRLDVRRAIAHERRRLIETRLRPALLAFSPLSFDRFRIAGDPRRLTTLRRLLAVEVGERLELHVQRYSEDEVERRGHLALGVLELADTLEAKLGGIDRVDEIHAWVHLIDAAISWADDATAGGGNATLRRSFTVAEEQGNDALFTQRRERLQRVINHMARVLSARRREWGLRAAAGDGTIENPGRVWAQGSSRELTRGQVFTIDGTSWEVLQVLQPFVFHPGVWRLRSVDRSALAGSELRIGSGEYLDESNRPDTPLLRVSIDNEVEPTTLTARDSETLTRLTWAVYMHDTLEQLGELATAIETVGGLAMDLAELFPGIGPAVAAARLVTGVMQVINGDLPGMITHFIDHPHELLQRLLEDVGRLLSPGNILEYLLFTNNSFQDTWINRPVTGPTNLGRTSSRRMQRLLHRLRTIARGAGHAFARMHDRVQDKRQTVEEFVQGRPRLVRLSDLIADHYFLLASLWDHISRTDVSELAGDIGEWPAQLDRMIESLGHVQLPEGILSLDDVVSVLLDVAGQRLGGKYRLGVQLLFRLLDFVGLRDDVVDAIASVIEAALRRVGITSIQRNDVLPLWRSTIVPEIRNLLGHAQTLLRDSMDRTFRVFELPVPLSGAAPNVELSGSDFPEPLPLVDASVGGQWPGGSLDATRAAALLAELPQEGGERLEAGVLADAQARFGSSFAHVRLHRDAAARSLARELHVDALTAGSHVVWNAGDPARPGARPVLWHELAHVVQQTGHAGRDGAPRPAPRTRHARLDRRAEAEAERAAVAASRGAPVRIGSTQSTAQPNVADTIGQHFFRQLGDIGPIETEAEDVDRAVRGAGRRLIGRDVRRAVQHVDSQLPTLLAEANLRVPAGSSFTSQKGNIARHLANQRAEIDAAIEDLAIRASYEAAPGRDGRAPRMALDVGDFTRRLERYILGKTGIQLELDANTRGHGREAVWQNPRQPFRHATVEFVYLPPIHGGTELWRQAMQHRSGPLNARGVALSDADRTELRPRVRAVLRQMGPSSQVWVRGEFRLSHAVYEAADEAMRSAGGVPLPAASIPTAVDYTDTTGTAATTGHGNVRLHLGSYGQRLNGGPQAATERESHHITQYLLVQYFHNGEGSTRETDPERMGFPLATKWRDAYPGLDTATDGTPLRHSGTVRIQDLEEGNGGRGGPMPAISIARVTHRRGNLHVNPRAEDFEGAGLSNQAGAVNHVYKDALPARYQQAERAAFAANDRSIWDAYLARPDVGAEAARTQALRAMQATYRWMRDYMQRQLQTALRGQERDYYNELGAAAHPGSSSYQVDIAATDRVWRAAVAHNNNSTTGMPAYGWTGTA